MLCCHWLGLISTPKIPAIVREFLLGKDKRVQELCKLRSYSFTRESVIISSIQVLFAEKCSGMNTASETQTKNPPHLLPHLSILLTSSNRIRSSKLTVMDDDFCLQFTPPANPYFLRGRTGGKAVLEHTR